MGERLRYIDYTKGIAIILVVVGHLLPSATGLLKWIYSFHIPLFFIVSGMMLGIKDIRERKFFKTVIKLIRTLIVPYVFFNIFGTAILYLSGLKDFVQAGLNQDIFLFLIGAGGHSTWFLTSLFVAQICFLIVTKIKNEYLRHIISVIIVAVGFILSNKIVLFISVTRGMIGYSFLYIGYLFSRVMSAKNWDIRKWKIPAGLGLLFINIVSTLLNSRVDMHQFVFGNIALYYIGNLAGTLFILFLCAKIENIRIKPLNYIGENSIIVQCTHGLLQSTVYAVFALGSGVAAQLINTVVVLLLELPLIYIITNYLGFIIGRKSLWRIKKAD